VSAAGLLAQARTKMQRLTALPESVRPNTIEDGYRVQFELISKLGAHFGGGVAGYKIACTNETAQRQLHVDHPFFGHLLAATTYESGARLDAAPFFMRVMEAEFAFLIGEDLPPVAGPRTRDEVAGAVAGVLPGIEIVDSRFESWTTVGTPSLIADNACHAAWVRGALVRDWRDIDLAAQPVQLVINGAIKDTGSGAAVLGHPLNALLWLANTLNERGLGLQAGQYVTTGVTTDMYLAGPGDHVQADFGRVGKVEVSFR
jgi:2-keto-4-pentenoate hydratase